MKVKKGQIWLRTDGRELMIIVGLHKGENYDNWKTFVLYSRDKREITETFDFSFKKEEIKRQYRIFDSSYVRTYEL